jgi:hypothetical protein
MLVYKTHNPLILHVNFFCEFALEIKNFKEW